jgi:hypothetical protein
MELRENDIVANIVKHCTSKISTVAKSRCTIQTESSTVVSLDFDRLMIHSVTLLEQAIVD